MHLSNVVTPVMDTIAARHDELSISEGLDGDVF